MGPGPTPEDDDDWIVMALQGVIADEVKSQIANPLATILDMMEEAAGQLFWAVSSSGQRRIRYVVYDAVEHVILYQIMISVLGEKTSKHVDQHFKAFKVTEEFCNRLLCNDAFLARIASFVQRHSMTVVTDQPKVEFFNATCLQPMRRRTQLWQQRPTL